MKWCEAVTLEFVKIYLEHEILWNPDNVFYRSKSQRDKAYTNICTKFKASTDMSLTIQEVKTKIRNLRTTYQQQIQKILQKSSPDSIYEPTLVWFNEMDKCLKNIPNKHSSYMVNETFEGNTSSHIWVGSDEKIKEEADPDPLFPQSDEDSASSKLEQSNQDIPIVQKKIKKKKKYKEQNIDAMVLNRTGGLDRLEDEFDIYGKYIATQLRKMDLQKALRLQLEIQSLISEARISDFIT